MNAERVNLQCRRGDVSGVISNVDRRQCVEYSSKYTTLQQACIGGIVGSGMGGSIMGKVGKFLLCNRMEEYVIYNAMYVIPLGSVARCVPTQ